MLPINVTRSSMPPLEEYIEEIRGLWDSHWLTNMGEKHQKFQTALEEYLKVPHVTLYTNGHLALEGILAAMNFPRGSEVITTPFTFASTTHAIVRSGLVPVFCDINDRDYTMDAAKIEALITDKTVAILPVHVYGNLCDTEAIQKIADKHGLKVIYDAAHAFGVTKNGVSAACFRDDAMVQTLNDLKNFGIHGPEAVPFVGGNAKMNEFQAAMGLCNLRHLQGEIAKRKEVVKKYRELLSGYGKITFCAPQPDVEPNYAYFPVVFESEKMRDAACERLKEQNIIARKYFYPLTNDFSCYKDLPTAGGDKTPIVRSIASRVVTLPLYAELGLDEVERICKIVSE